MLALAAARGTYVGIRGDSNRGLLPLPHGVATSAEAQSARRVALAPPLLRRRAVVERYSRSCSRLTGGAARRAPRAGHAAEGRPLAAAALWRRGFRRGALRRHDDLPAAGGTARLAARCAARRARRLHAQVGRLAR
eukprot:6824771-Prymnesium_polylepis.1